jgi:phosphatidylethanolamine-binding protein (PEBP) family uncharacterized protein
MPVASDRPRWSATTGPRRGIPIGQKHGAGRRTEAVARTQTGQSHGYPEYDVGESPLGADTYALVCYDDGSTQLLTRAIG